jgi:hypothetical protein
MVAYFTYTTHRMDHERAHIQVMPCVVTATSKEIIRFFFHLLNTHIVHAQRQHDNVICKKYLMLDPCDILQKECRVTVVSTKAEMLYASG